MKSSVMEAGREHNMYSLDRFVEAQQDSYVLALEEIRGGQKRSHWMWFIFPQLRALGRSATAHYFGIEDRQEAEAYLQHPVLGKRLEEISLALLALDSSDALAIFGHTDKMKLCSCMTLFYEVSHWLVFRRVLEKFFDGMPDQNTLALLGGQSEAK